MTKKLTDEEIIKSLENCSRVPSRPIRYRQ